MNEWFSKSKSLAQIFSIKRLDEILINATYTHQSENTKNQNINAPSYEYYDYPIEILRERYCAVVTVRIVQNGKSDRHIYYHHYLDNVDIKK